MKKILLYFKIALLIATANSTAQTFYSNYLDGTSEWRYYNMVGSEQSDYYEKFYQTIFFDGTEDYGGYTYHKERFFTVIKYYDQLTDELLLVDEYYPTLYNLVREDAQGRFYRRAYFTYTVEEMYQDNALILNSQLGDNFPSLADFNFGVCPVVTIEQMNIANLSLKKLLGLNGPYGGLVEGVGPLGQACDGGANSLVCYTKQGDSLIFEPGTDCSIFPVPVRLNTESFNKNTIVIFPNPTDGIVNIVATEDNIDSIELWDILGRKLITQENTSLDLSSFSKGTYLIIIKANAKIQTQRIIKN